LALLRLLEGESVGVLESVALVVLFEKELLARLE
jgi:hypothetical protein